MIHIFDGAMGTMLQQTGLCAGYCPEIWNIENSAAVSAVHREYIASGADIIETNTFGANRIKLGHYGLADKVALINRSGVKAARMAAGRNTKIAGAVGPTGKFIHPLGELDFDEAYEVFFEQIEALDEAGSDYIIIETVIDIQEMRAALLAAKAATKKPVICQLSFADDGRTVTGTDPGTAAIILEAMGADVIGANCSLGPAQLLEVVKKFAANTSRPISVQPNAGMPKLIDGQTVFPMGADEMASWVPKLLEAGASLIGGCCGTTPQHIKAIKDALGQWQGKTNSIYTPGTALTSRSKTIFVGYGHSTAIIGERINPTGRKALAAAIRNDDFSLIKKEALQQIQAGAAILDVNMGVPDVDQQTVMKKAVTELAMLTDAPLSIDTTDPYALEAGLKAYPGRALVNSISAEPERMEHFLPLAKKYGAAVLCLPITAAGIPLTVEERIATVKSIIDNAFAAGLRSHDLLLDALVLTVAANPQAANETLQTLKLYRQHFGYPTVVGLSNISHGLPQRDVLNAVFCTMALEAGLDAPILNPYDPLMKQVLLARGVLSGQDENATHYIRYYTNVECKNETKSSEQPCGILAQIGEAVIHGEKEGIIQLVKQAVSDGYSAITIAEQGLAAGMNEMGKAYTEGRCFLPQVMLAAETMRIAFDAIRGLLPSQRMEKSGTVVLATVKGDIHDLGKNIVAALLENNGFEVVDLGKDVPSEKVVEAAARTNADVVGLCALMTTTMPQIDVTVSALQRAGVTAHTLVGGAVLTSEYAASAGADAYAANGIEAVLQVKRLVKGKQHE